MSDFNMVMQEGMKRVWELDCKEQSSFLNIVAEARGSTAEPLKKVGAFFVPNHEYMALRFGDVVRDWEFDCYYGEECKWTGHLVVPVWGVGGIVALAGFNPFQYVGNRESGDWSTPYYKYSASRVFKKGRFVWAAEGGVEKAIKDGYVFVVDGLFDAISLLGEGFNAWALMDSSITQERVILMRFVKRVILIADNDAAGVKVWEQLRKRVHCLELWKQNKTKDVDELLKSPFRSQTIKQLKEVVRGGALSVRKAFFFEPL